MKGVFKEKQNHRKEDQISLEDDEEMLKNNVIILVYFPFIRKKNTFHLSIFKDIQYS